MLWSLYAWVLLLSGLTAPVAAVDTPLTRQLQTLLTGQAGTSHAAAETLKITRYAGYVIELETGRFLLALQDERDYVVEAAMRCLENNRSWKSPVLTDALFELLTTRLLTQPEVHYALCIKPVFLRLEEADRFEFVSTYLASDAPATLLALLPLAKEARLEFSHPSHFDRLLVLLRHPDSAVAIAALEALYELVWESNHERIAPIIAHLEGGAEPLHARAKELFSTISPHSESDREAIREGLLAAMRAVESKSKTASLAKSLRRSFQKAPLKPKPKSSASTRLNCPGILLRSGREMRGSRKAIGDD